MRVNIIAAQTLKAAKATLARASDDAGVRYTFYLLTQLALASRNPDWEGALSQHGIVLSEQSSVFHLTAQVQGAIDRYIGATTVGATDLSEMAQQAVGEALTSLLAAHTPSIFDDADNKNLKIALRPLSTKRGFGQLGQRFFARFVARFLKNSSIIDSIIEALGESVRCLRSSECRNQMSTGAPNPHLLACRVR